LRDIFEVPARRSTNMIGISLIRNPFLHVLELISIWKRSRPSRRGPVDSLENPGGGNNLKPPVRSLTRMPVMIPAVDVGAVRRDQPRQGQLTTVTP